jgi:orotidine-5'-phosphate decarboxylase
MKEKLIVALDGEKFRNEDYLVETVSMIYDRVDTFKIGLELITFFGAKKLIEILRSVNPEIKIFLDQKFHDIDKTVLNSCEIVFDLDVDILTVHASNGRKTLRDISNLRDKLKNEKKCRTEIFAVSVLTSLTEDDNLEIYNISLFSNFFKKLPKFLKEKILKYKVLQFAKMAKDCGLDGIICSPLELKFLSKRKELAGLKFITPGIRNKNSKPDGQNRNATAKEAIENGAYKIVVGRPITESENMQNAISNL